MILSDPIKVRGKKQEKKILPLWIIVLLNRTEKIPIANAVNTQQQQQKQQIQSYFVTQFRIIYSNLI